jgi:cytochrome c peroxidase
MKIKVLITSLLLILLSAHIVNAKEETKQWSDSEIALLKTLIIDALPKFPDGITNKYAENTEAAELGHKIFFDKRFSANGKVSCSTCHQPEKYFTDGLKTSKGIGTVKRNAPTVVGINHSKWFFHDGRADSLWSQALGPLEDSLEHGGNRTMFAHQIFSDKKYKEKYESIFGELPNLSDKTRFPDNAGPVQDKKPLQAWQSMQQQDRDAITQVFVNIGKAIAAYEHKLRPATSKFDRYVQAVINKEKSGMYDSMTEDEISGLKLFISNANCVICHNGPMLSDFEFHNVRTPVENIKNYDKGRKTGVSKVKKSKFNCFSKYNDAEDKNCDELTYIVSGEHETLGNFRTPSLRNISRTAPYMHSGQYETLSDVINHYNNPPPPPPIKLGENDIRMLTFNQSETEQQQLELFLKTLDSDIDAEPRWLKAPVAK